MSWICVTGSSKGLGEQIAYVFARNGFNVIVHGRDKVRCSLVANNIRKLGVDCKVVVGDIRERLTINRLILCVKDVGASILVNNAASLSFNKSFDKLGYTEIYNMIETNLISPMMLVNSLYKELDVIININSRCAVRPSGNHVVYSASKMGLRGFSEALHDEYPDLCIIDVYLGRIEDYRHEAEDIISRYTTEFECFSN